MTDDIKRDIKQFIMAEFLPGENPDELSDTTLLISGGVLDSIATLKLVMHLEQVYGIELEPHEVDKENLDTLDQIARMLARKLGTRS